MSIAIVYWTQTGNTEAMANILADACGGEAIEWDGFSAAQVAGYDALAFGCPAMGDEELDPDFEELWNECKGELANKPVVLFGSYDWGTGEWMETWEGDARDAGVNLVETVVAHLEPDDEVEDALRAAAAKLP
jgi:flavodoxin short chain